MTDPRVFISYARRDGADFAHALRQRLETEHPEIPLWQDRVGMEGGRDWWQQITEALDKVEFMVLVMTPAALKSDTVRREWRYARAQGVLVYPVKADPDLDFSSLPRWMRDVHWYDLDHEWIKFTNDLNTRHETPKVPFMVEPLPDDFVERPTEFDALRNALLDKERGDPVAITAALKGAGGFGKTTLAKALCYDDDVQTAFDDGILWVELGKSPNVLKALNMLYNALSREDHDFGTIDEAAYRLNEKLGNLDCLIVLDDVWDAAHLRPFLRGGPHCAHLITTRQNDVVPYSSHKVKVDAMQPDEAVQLLSNGISVHLSMYGEGSGVGLNFKALAQRLGEWPLLLKLANGAMHRRIETNETPAQAIEWVNQALTRKGLKALDDPGDRESRHRAAEATLRVSLDLLSDDEFHYYTRLAIFPEDAPLPYPTLEKLWGLDEFDVDDLCGRLFGLSLLLTLDRATRRIRLHDVLRTFLRDENKISLTGWNHEFLDTFTLPLANVERGLGGEVVFSWADLPADEPYLWDWLAYHLVEAGHAEELMQTVTDLRYLAAKTHARDAFAAEADLIAAETAIPSDTLVPILKRNFANAGHFLKCADSPRGIAITLHSRLQHLPELAQLCDDLENRLHPFVTAWRDFPDLPHPALIRTLAGHADIVRGCVFSPDGKSILSASNDKTLKLWDADTGQEIRSFIGHASIVRGCAFSPDGKSVLSASNDKTLKLWDADTGQEIRSFIGHANGVRACAFSPDGKSVLSTSYDKTLKLWDADTGQEIRSFIGHTNAVRACAFSPDSKLILSASYDKTLKLWDANTRQEIRSLIGHANIVNACALSPDGKSVLSTSNDTTLKLWDGSIGQDISSFSHTSIVRACALSPDGKLVLSASYDKTLKLWDANTGQEIRSFACTARVNACAFSPDGKSVLSASNDTTLKLWDANTGEEICSFVGHTARVNTCAFSPDGKIILSASSDRTLKLWDTSTHQQMRSFSGHSSLFGACIFSPDSNWIASASSDQTVRIWAADTGQCIAILAVDGPLNCVAWHPDGEHLIAGGRKGLYWLRFVQ